MNTENDNSIENAENEKNNHSNDGIATVSILDRVQKREAELPKIKCGHEKTGEKYSVKQIMPFCMVKIMKFWPFLNLSLQLLFLCFSTDLIKTSKNAFLKEAARRN